MTTFQLHDTDSAPRDAKPILEESQKSMGMIPNLHAVLAEAPQTLKAYGTLHELFTNTSFNNDEITVVWQTINVEHECHYCVPAHTAIAKQMGVSDEISQALRNETALPDAKLEALRTFTKQVIAKRGNLDQPDLEAFFKAGYDQQQVLEVILGLAQKTISNYVNHIAETPLDEPFQSLAWKRS
ncbi:AhpD family alkylhydroperoxidase [Halospina denitrificans]|uniref:AhpD family alkylhydroperoxidase n=1 Tax=Halospina denitrificans TaxID=332522 RepID=A0A4R7K0S5_9GAMM|nr:carboxymuconolactone decarboxylase family protein [Halospina denitrificans]TDT44155.1 AhpD family alkylhydroperoxidase [Halospina denitrificans]